MYLGTETAQPDAAPRPDWHDLVRHWEG
jgi:hypothetical protein